MQISKNSGWTNHCNDTTYSGLVCLSTLYKPVRNFFYPPVISTFSFLLVFIWIFIDDVHWMCPLWHGCSFYYRSCFFLSLNSIKSLFAKCSSRCPTCLILESQAPEILHVYDLPYAFYFNASYLHGGLSVRPLTVQTNRRKWRFEPGKPLRS